jgi:virulence-associated protein VapD
MSSHRPTTLERAYALARSGSCRTVSEIKQALQAEGFERIQDSLYGPTLTAALRKLCQEHHIAAPEDETVESPHTPPA